AQGKEIPHDFPWDYPSGNIFEKMLSGNYISTTSLVMTRKEVFEKSGYFDEHPDMRCSQDSNLWVRIAHDYKIGYIAEALVKYRYHTGGTSRSAIKTYRGKIYSQKKILEMYGKEKNIYAEKIRGRMEEFYKSYAYTFWKQKNYPMCRDALDGLMEIGSLSKKEFIYYYLSHVPLIANIVNR
ncbi:MAG: hypothetical protein KJP25_12630, partial [Gammaproteobacteria bacterium]|nr:hypothetical protein [Gammaproteobacteria bacterium]